MTYAAKLKAGVLAAFATLLLLMAALPAEAAEWTVSRSSGGVWLMSESAQAVSLGSGAVVQSGDKVRTDANGRVLLTRGEETILVSPNSVIGLPAERDGDGKTTILQQAGSILLSVEKKNVKHFQVETPFLAAVVKGTQFNVTVSPQGARVDVERGKVEVADFKSGQIALVLPGQSAVADTIAGGLKLSGSGRFEPIRQGPTKQPRVKAAPVPGGGSLNRPAKFKAAKVTGRQNGARIKSKGKPMRIKAPIGEIKVNFAKATKGLARAATANRGRQGGAGRSGKAKSNVASAWSGGGKGGPKAGKIGGLGKSKGNGSGKGAGLGFASAGGGLKSGPGGGGGGGAGLGHLKNVSGCKGKGKNKLPGSC